MVRIKQTTILIYLLAIQEMAHRKKEVKNNDLAKILSVSPASISEMLEKLRRENYLEDGFQLTDKANRVLQNYKSRFI